MWDKRQGYSQIHRNIQEVSELWRFSSCWMNTKFNIFGTSSGYKFTLQAGTANVLHSTYGPGNDWDLTSTVQWKQWLKRPKPASAISHIDLIYIKISVSARLLCDYRFSRSILNNQNKDKKMQRIRLICHRLLFIHINSRETAITHFKCICVNGS